MSVDNPTPQQAAVQTLIDAIGKGRIEDAKAAIRDGADVNAENVYRRRPLFFAIRDGKTDIVRLLLEHGADVNMPVDRDSRRPLWYAASGGNEEIVGDLIAAGAEINAVDDYGGTALGNCALSLSNAILNMPNPKAWCAEQDRRPTGLTAIAEELILQGADVNLEKKGHYTPAHFIRTTNIPRLIALLKGREKRGWFSR